MLVLGKVFPIQLGFPLPLKKCKGFLQSSDTQLSGVIPMIIINLHNCKRLGSNEWLQANVLWPRLQLEYGDLCNRGRK